MQTHTVSLFKASIFQWELIQYKCSENQDKNFHWKLFISYLSICMRGSSSSPTAELGILCKIMHTPFLLRHFLLMIMGQLQKTMGVWIVGMLVCKLRSNVHCSNCVIAEIMIYPQSTQIFIPVFKISLF